MIDLDTIFYPDYIGPPHDLFVFENTEASLYLDYYGVLDFLNNAELDQSYYLADVPGRRVIYLGFLERKKLHKHQGNFIKASFYFEVMGDDADVFFNEGSSIFNTAESAAHYLSALLE